MFVELGFAHSAATYHISSLQLKLFLNFVDWDTYLLNRLLTWPSCFSSDTKNLHACSGILRRRNWKVGEESSKRWPNFYYVDMCVGLLATKRLGVCIRTSFSCWESETQSATYTRLCSFSPVFVFRRGHWQYFRNDMRWNIGYVIFIEVNLWEFFINIREKLML